MIDLNPEQLEAVQWSGGHLLVLAGPGTGKTRTIISRAAHLISKGTPANRIVVLTFTRRAAKEIKDRLAAESNARGIHAGTFHHFCLAEMRRAGGFFDLANFTIIDRDDQVALFKIARASVIPKDNVAVPKPEQLLAIFSFARNTNKGVPDYLARFTRFDGETQGLIIRCFREYEDRKARNRYLDYDDILHRFARVVRKTPALKEQLRKRYDHFLVDEFQDTNPLQWLILDELRDPAKLYCVGDDAQSIYAFRGADFKNVHEFKTRVPGAEVRRLSLNYRSTQEILDLSNWLLAESSLDYSKHLKAVRGSGARPRLVECDSEFSEADFIAGDIQSRFSRGMPFSDVECIIRTAHAGRMLEAEFVRRQIPYRFIGGMSLLQSAHIKDLLCLLRVSLNHRDELAWVRYLTMYPRIGEQTAVKTVNRIVPLATGDEAELALDLLYPGHDLSKTFAAVREEQEPVLAVRTAARRLDEVLARRYDNWDRRKGDFAILEKLAARYDTTAALLEALTLDPVTNTEADEEANRDAVTLITAHSAKGTESKLVYVVRAEPGMYPHVRSLGDPEREEEERRVLYVALTRAEDELVITRSCGAFEATTFSQTSETPYLLDDLPADLVLYQAVDEIEDDDDPFGPI